MPRVGIALGSNLGDKFANIRAASEHLRAVAVAGEPFLAASVYQTEPVHCPPGSPLFYNSVVEIAFEGEPSALLALTQGIEKRLGRDAHPERNAPRVIDVDLLYFGSEILDTDNLVIPHPRIHERRFVLQPLAQIRPELILPGQIDSVAGLLQSLDSEEPPLVSIHG